MMRPINFKPSAFLISEKAMKAIAKHHDNETIHLALEVMRSNRLLNTPVKKMTFTERLKNIFRPQSSFTVVLDKDVRDNFFISAIRTINKKVFKGDNVIISFDRIAHNRNAFDEALAKSKEGIQKHLSIYKKICKQ